MKIKFVQPEKLRKSPPKDFKEVLVRNGVIKNERGQENMAKKKQLTKRQLAVIEDLFSDFSMVDEQAVLDKHKVSRNLYNKWLAEASFTEQFDRRIAAAYRQSAALIARYAPLAAAKLVQLTDSNKEETARKACLDIISVPQIANHSSQVANRDTSGSQIAPQLSDQTVSRLLAILAEEKND